MIKEMLIELDELLSVLHFIIRKTRRGESDRALLRLRVLWESPRVEYLKIDEFFHKPLSGKVQECYSVKGAEELIKALKRESLNPQTFERVPPKFRLAPAVKQ